MKKLLTAVLALALSLSLCAPAFAAESTITEDGGKKEIDVNAKYVDNTQTPTVYHVDVSWGAMEFTYTVSGTKTWNAEAHNYTVNTSGTWAASGNEIAVTNHSNTGIKADFTYAKAVGFDTVTGSFTQNSLTLPTAEGKETTDAALIGKTTLTLSGTLSSDKTALTRVGKVTVKISKP